MIRGSITYTGMEGIKRSELRRAVKKELQHQVDDWHSNILPRHFQRGAAGRYKYQERSRKYNRRKSRKYGHTRPLELTGDLKRRVLRRATITGTSKRATATMDAPRYLYKYKPEQPDKAAELTAVTQEEATKMAFTLDRNLTVHINNNTRRRTVRP
jgi:hypothetical protein